MTLPIPRPWGALVAAIVIAGVIVLGIQSLASRLPMPQDAGQARLFDAGFTLALFGLLGGCGLVLALRRGGVAALIGPRPLAMAGLGAAIGLGGLLAAFAYARIAGVAVPVNAASAGAGALLLGTVATIVQTAAEEVYFRGWLQRALGDVWGPVAALLVTAIVFAGLHLLGGARAPLSLVNLLLGGLLFGLLAQRSGGIAASIAAHLLWNWSEQLLLGLDPNPGTGSFGALFDHDLIGAPLWGGSPEGLNASLAVTLVMAALLLPLATWRRGAVRAAS
jgi:membrane protease YdiL (CAAX protease family)